MDTLQRFGTPSLLALCSMSSGLPSLVGRLTAQIRLAGPPLVGMPSFGVARVLPGHLRFWLSLLFAPPPFSPPAVPTLRDSATAAAHWVLLAVAAACLLWLLATFFQVTGLSTQALARGAWQLLPERFLIAGVVCIVTWRLGDLAGLVLGVLAAHQSDPTTAHGLIGLPTGAFGDLFGYLLSLVVQGVVAWLFLRVAWECLAGLLSLTGLGRQPLGATLWNLGLVVLLALGVLCAVPATIWFISFVTS